MACGSARWEPTLLLRPNYCSDCSLACLPAFLHDSVHSSNLLTSIDPLLTFSLAILFPMPCCQVVLPHPKQQDKDVVVFLEDAQAAPTEEEAEQRAAVAALHRVQVRVLGGAAPCCPAGAAAAPVVP